jgi:hypothetical protein
LRSNSSSALLERRRGAAEVVDLHGVVDDQVDRHEGLIFGVAAEARTMALRIAARSTTQGTPVKSCRSRGRHLAGA